MSFLLQIHQCQSTQGNLSTSANCGYLTMRHHLFLIQRLLHQIPIPIPKLACISTALESVSLSGFMFLELILIGSRNETSHVPLSLLLCTSCKFILWLHICSLSLKKCRKSSLDSFTFIVVSLLSPCVSPGTVRIGPMYLHARHRIRLPNLALVFTFTFVLLHLLVYWCMSAFVVLRLVSLVPC